MTRIMVQMSPATLHPTPYYPRLFQPHEQIMR